MSYYALVTTLQNVRAAPNSDRLYLAEVFHEGVVVGQDAVEGQVVLYLPTDGHVERWFGNVFNLFRKNEDGTPQGGYLENNGHIKAIKLRGNQSSGIIIPIGSIYSKFGFQGWQLNDKVAEINGKAFCSKYIPPQTYNPQQKGQPKRVSDAIYPEFERHVETEQLDYNLNQFAPGDQINLTLKMHGTSQRSMNTYEIKPLSWFRKLFHMRPRKKQAYVLGTRRAIITKNSQGYYGSEEFRKSHHERLKACLKPGMEVFYEVVGYYGAGENETIMPSGDNNKLNDKDFIKEFGPKTTFSYGCVPGQSEMYVYRITANNGEHEYTPQEITDWCARNGFNRVPVIDDFVFTTTEDMLDRINKYFEDLHDPVGKTHIKEGVVVRIVNRRTFTAYKSKTFAFKCIEGLIKDSSAAPDMEEMEENG